MEKYKNITKIMTNILNLKSYPVGVKFYKDADKLLKEIGESFDGKSKYRYCQALMEARFGDRVILHKDNITCPASAAAFGFKPLVEKLRQGEMLFQMGLFASKEAAARTMAMIPRLELGYYQAVALGPLSDINFKPDVIIVESATEHIMWLALVSYYDQGGRLLKSMLMRN